MRRPTRGDLRRLIALSPADSLALVTRLTKRLASARREQMIALVNGTHAKTPDSWRLRPRSVNLDESSLDTVREEELAEVTERYLDHRFDLLGSDWVQVRYGMRCRGLEEHRFEPGPTVAPDARGTWLTGRVARSTIAESRRLWSLVDPGYIPIDWQLDFKSGFRWNGKTWSTGVRYGSLQGADIKVPWELARMQHLPELAIAHALASRGRPGFHEPETYAREFRNVVLDFAATNPPGFGANWACAMEVGIRAMNWLVAYELFAASGTRFDDDFERILARSVYEHGLHITRPSYIEWHPKLRSNHYLSDIVALLYIAAYLPRTPLTDAWLAFSVQELIAEAQTQFQDDGTNFEASTSYHRLSAELLVYATALVLGFSDAERAALAGYDHRLVTAGPGLRAAPLPFHEVPGTQATSPFPLWYFERLERAAEFTAHTTKPTGDVVQVGDNDSGRCIKLTRHRENLTEKHLRHDHIVSAMAAIVGPGDNAPVSVETTVMTALAKGVRASSHRLAASPTPAELLTIGTDEALTLRGQGSSSSGQTLRIPIEGGGARHGLRTYGYPNFGLYIFRSDRLFLSVRCGHVGQLGNGGHAHNDQLSIELCIDDRDLVTDPGTYVYTPLPHRRNAYRSVSAHFAPRVGDAREPGRLDLGLFHLPDATQASCDYFGPRGFVGRHHGFGQSVVRMIVIEDDSLTISDFALGDLELKSPGRGVPVSRGYGLVAGPNDLSWTIEESAWR